MSASIGVEKETDAQGRLKRHVDTKLRFKIYSVERVPSRQTILANATKQEGDQQIGVGLQRINGLKHLFESSFFVGCRSKGKRNATKPCFELLIRAIRLILPWHKHLSDEKEHHQIER
ncbi:Methionine aminopeptidase [Trichinella spiralis]|uniref:Methionine aminopeptidase n=1 Tax=Trichinella spiralis TaxID=6334 RepID=A0ABR3KFQ5_TRISP